MSSVHVPLLRDLLERRSGLDLGRGGMEVNLVNFVQRQLALRGLSFERYFERLETPGSEELRQLVETMTVVYTWFFRDPGQFQVIEQLMRDFPQDRKMGIWVAGCATGEEPYSVALVAAEQGRSVDILGTDLNSQALSHARAGQYAATSLDAVDATMRRRYLPSVSDQFVVPESVKQTVRFQIGNLVESPPQAPTQEGWDLVICRNVLIYFGAEQARRTLERLASSLAPGGTLILGASEAILERPSTLQITGVAGRAVLVRPHPDVKSSFTRLSPPKYVPAEPRPPSRPQLAVATPHVLPSPLQVALPNVRGAIEQGHLALESGDVPNARESYLRAVALDPTSAEALMFAGIAQYLDGALTEALHHLRGALCLDASLWTACFYQALCYENMGYSEDAARSYSQVLQLTNDGRQPTDEHPLFKGWRHDLLAVARKRVHQSRTEYGSGKFRARAIVR